MRYNHPVNGIPIEKQAGLIKRSIDAVLAIWPKRTGMIFLVMDIGEGGGVAYGANITRATAIELMKEFIRHEENKA